MAEEVDVSALADLVRIRRDEDLLRERLDKMEARKESVSDVVFKRVRADYESRRAALESEARAPREKAGRAYARLKVLATDAGKALEDARLAREEVDFRHELGEFPEEEFADKRRVGDELVAEKQARVDELAKLKERFLEAFHTEEELERAAGPPAAQAPAPRAAAPPPTPAPKPRAAEPEPARPEPEPEPVPATFKAALSEMSPVGPPPVRSQPTPAPPAAIPPVPVPEVPRSVLPAPPAFSPDATVAGPPPERSPAFSPDATALGVSVAVSSPEPKEARSATLMMSVARLLVVQEDGQGPEYVLKPEPTSVGRAPESAIRLPYPDVSRQHATIFPVEGGFKIVDRGSPNGLFVNGARLKEHLLADGDVIQIGRRKLIFRS